MGGGGVYFVAVLVSQNFIYKKLKENRGLGWGEGGENTT